MSVKLGPDPGFSGGFRVWKVQYDVEMFTMARDRDRGLDLMIPIVPVTFPVPENLAEKETQHLLVLKIQQLNM